MEINNNIIRASKGKYIARKGSSQYFVACTMLHGETISDFVEVNELPSEDKQFDEEAYKHRVQLKIHERYSLDDEIALLRQKDKKPQEYAEYEQFTEACKAEVKSEMLEEHGQ